MHQAEALPGREFRREKAKVAAEHPWEGVPTVDGEGVFGYAVQNQGAASEQVMQGSTFGAWSEQLIQTLNFFYYVSATSGLALDSDYASLFLIDITSVRLPRELNFIGQLRGLAFGPNATDSLDPASLNLTRSVVREERQAAEELEQGLGLLARQAETDQVATAITEMTASNTEDINRNTTGIRSSTVQVLSGIESDAGTAERLAGLSQDLRSVVSRFRLSA